MDFFEHQDQARRNTVVLVVYFCVAVALIVAAVTVTVLFALGLSADSEEGLASARQIWKPEIALAIAAGTLFIILCGSLFKTFSLRGGGSVVAGMFGGLPVSPDTSDPDLRRLLDVVEEMALASGSPVPPVFLLEEKGINAFAAGYRTEDAVVAVTRGSIEELSRDELQGVIAHEFSHILNGDMRTNVRMMGVLHGILLIAMIGRVAFQMGAHTSHRGRYRSRSSKRDGGGGQLLIIVLGLAFMAIGFIGVFFGKLIKGAVSRQREFLADASAVQFTRYPDGISGALKKIGGFVSGSKVKHPRAEEASHFFFGNALPASLFEPFSTHPPLDERIRRIDPRFDGEFKESSPTGAASGLGGAASGFAGGPGPASEPIKTSAERVVGQVGAPQPEHIEYARGLRKAIPPLLANSIRDAFGARAVVYALLLDRDPEVRTKQARLLADQADKVVYRETLKVQKECGRLDPRLRLPLIDLAIPALSNLSDSQYERFVLVVEGLIEADERLNLFEFALKTLLLRNLAPKFSDPVQTSVRYENLAPLAGECQTLLSAMAHAGSRKKNEAEAAFEEAHGKLKTIADRVQLEDRKLVSLKNIERALARLDQAAPQAKKRLLDACATAVIRDGKVTIPEAELLRAVCDSLGCPMPPILGRA